MMVCGYIVANALALALMHFREALASDYLSPSPKQKYF
jgi:hypothetical protein